MYPSILYYVLTGTQIETRRIIELKANLDNKTLFDVGIRNHEQLSLEPQGGKSRAKKEFYQHTTPTMIQVHVTDMLSTDEASLSTLSLTVEPDITLLQLKRKILSILHCDAPHEESRLRR